MALILFSDIDIPRESTRWPSKVTEGKPRNDLVGAKEARFSRSN